VPIAFITFPSASLNLSTLSKSSLASGESSTILIVAGDVAVSPSLSIIVY